MDIIQQRIEWRIGVLGYISTAYNTEHGYFRNHLTTIGLLQGDMICRLFGQIPESTKHLLLECESLYIRIFEDKQPSVDVDFGDKSLEHGSIVRL